MIREKKVPVVEPMLLRIRDAAAMLSVSERTVWQLLRAGELRAIRLPRMRAVRIARHDVENLVERWHNRATTPAETESAIVK